MTSPYVQPETTVWTIARTSPGTITSAAGVVSDVAANTSRLSLNPVGGLLIESTRTNLLTNPTFSGAVVTATPGTGTGTDPTNMLFAETNGLSRDIVAAGVNANGEYYCQLRVYGTSTNILASIYLDTASNCAVSAASTYSLSLGVRLAAGTTAGINVVAPAMTEYAGGTVNGVYYSATSTALTSAKQRISYSRGSLVGTPLGGTTTIIRPGLRITVNTGVAVDFTIEMTSPQFEIGPFPSSVIRPLSQVTGQVTRQADDVQRTTFALATDFPNIASTAATPGGAFQGAFIMAFAPFTGRDHGVCRFDNGTDESNKIVLVVPGGTSTLTYQVWAAGVQIVNLALGTINIGTVNRFVIGFGPGSYIGALNKAAAVTSIAAGYPTGISRLVLGRSTLLAGSPDTNGGAMLNGFWQGNTMVGADVSAIAAQSNSDPSLTPLAVLVLEGLPTS